MDTLIVSLIVLAAGGFLGSRALGSWRKSRAASAGCASDCGCSSADKVPASWDKTGVV